MDDFYYHLFGKRVASSLPLGSFPLMAAGLPAIRLARVAHPSPPRAVVWYHTIRDARNERYLSFGRVPKGFLLRAHGRADFYIEGGGHRIFYRERGPLGHVDIAGFFVAHALPLAVNLLGTEILHASAVCLSRTAIAFGGRSGAGKSTLAEAFLRSGGSLLTDDALMISYRGSRIYAYPGLPELRLWKGRAKSRHAVREGFQHRPVPLSSFYVLEAGVGHKEVSWEPVRSAEALPLLLENSFRLNLFDRRRMEREMALLAAFIERVPIFRFRFPRQRAFLPKLVKLIGRHQAELGRRVCF